MEASTQKRQDIFNPSRTEITKMINENLVNSFFASRLFLDACKLWQEQQHTGTLLKLSRRYVSKQTVHLVVDCSEPADTYFRGLRSRGVHFSAGFSLCPSQRDHMHTKHEVIWRSLFSREAGTKQDERICSESASPRAPSPCTSQSLVRVVLFYILSLCYVPTFVFPATLLHISDPG